MGIADPGGRPAGSAPAGSTANRSVLVVDDSAIVRRLVVEVIGDEVGLEVVGEAADGVDARRQSRVLKPDVIVVDLHMPGTDSLELIRELRADHPTLGVVVFANVETSNVPRVTEALRGIRAELVLKPTGVTDLQSALAEIRQRLVPLLRRAPAAASPTRYRRSSPIVHAIVMAASTGGPAALEQVLGGIGHLSVPLFIVQHIATGFSHRLAARLDHVSGFPVAEAEDGIHPEPGHAYLSPGGIHLTVARDGARPVLRLRDLPPVNSCRPSADVLFHSSVDVYGANQLAVVLTGIGEDGLAGCRSLSDLGATVVVQDEASSVVWGMPGAVADAGVADEVVPLDQIASRIERLATTPRPASRSREAR